jgi:hypothetical protein
LRGILDKGGIAERHRPHVAALARRARGGPRPLEAIAAEHGLVPSAVVALAANEDWNGLAGLSVQRRAARPSLRRRAGRARDWAEAFRGPLGFSVAIIGPDGAGKDHPRVRAA